LGCRTVHFGRQLGTTVSDECMVNINTFRSVIANCILTYHTNPLLYYLADQLAASKLRLETTVPPGQDAC
jgi:hypothetical protein